MTKPSVLVVDDEQLIRWSIRAHLERTGYNVDVAENGKQARERFGDDVGLVLMDLKLPDADGLELLREFKHRRPDCRFIVITAYGTPEVAVAAQKYGACLVLDKPFGLDEMARTVEEALAGNLSSP